MIRCLITPLLLVLVTVARAQAPDDKRIVPGERIGPWTLAVTVDDLNRVIGPKQAIGNPEGQTEFLPRQQDLVKPLWIHRWDQVRLRGLTVERDDAQIVGLTIFLDTYRTAEGIGIGSTRGEVMAAYGEPSAETAPSENLRHLIYDTLGITVRVRANVAPPEQKVVLVNIFRRGTARERWRY
jgi:hypothetical protein